MLDGHKVNGLYGMIRTTLNAVKRIAPTHLFLVWDSSPLENWRLKLFPNYKAHRKPKNEQEYADRKAIGMQVDWAQEFFSYLPVHQLRYIGLEGDDLAYWIVRRLFGKSTPKRKFVCATIDRDWLQLVRWDTKVFLTDLDYVVSLEDFRESTTEVIADLKGTEGIALADFLKFKQLVGDTSDGVPGAMGIGKKTALKFLSENWTLEECAEANEKVFRDYNQVQLNRILFDLGCYPYTEHLDRVLKSLCQPSSDFRAAEKFLLRKRFTSVLVDWLEFVHYFEDLQIVE